MCLLIQTNKLLCIQSTNRGTLNVFTGQKATQEQATDMLAFRDIGTQAFQDYVKHQILQQSCSTKPTLRRHKLLTMKPPKLSKRKSNPKEQEAKQVIKCLRHRLA